ncbi:eukaryotic translation initiation factor 4 gamma 1-like [Hippoglossus hippoglossus]|uniref:eukaryotic translation initiation factor 4 gamma 1-like n=1 Tax=Hippoglossus hippoglossus TaxID=8267 RepID=UPI00148C9830|nr:eukaryotic translation initiation factor 4 gamma 1-like [Hippoglossus hippoglossus]
MQWIGSLNMRISRLRLWECHGKLFEAVRKEQVQPEESVSCVTENFQAFMTELSHEKMDIEESLQETVELLFERAVQRQHSAAVFAELCQRLSTVEVQSLSDWSASVSFRSLLVKHCQAEYRKNFDREDISQKRGSCLEPVRDVRVIDRLREDRNNARPSCRSLNTIRFIGELFISKVLAEKAMHSCIRRLLQNGDGPSLESLCELLQLIQQDLEVVMSREVMDSFYNLLEFIAEEGKRAPRLSLLLKDTVDTRKRAGSTPH